MDSATISAFLAIGAIIFIGFFGSLIFTRFKIPDILILIALGMILGPELLGAQLGIITYSTLDDINQYRDLLLSAALVLILFDGGLGLNLRSVTESMRLATFMTVIGFILTMFAVGFALHSIMGINFLLSLCLGAIVGGTSSAIVLPIVAKMSITPKTKAMLSMESIVTDVLIIVAVLTLLSLVRLGEIDFVIMSKDLAIKFLVGGGVGLAAGTGWLFVLQKLQNQPLSYMITIAFLFLLAGLVELPPISSSGAVAALTFGLAIGNRKMISDRLLVSLHFESDVRIQQFHSEITFFVRTFFFVYLGMMFGFETFTQIHFVAGLLVISMIVLVRWLIALSVHKMGDLEMSDSMTVFSLMPRGLAAAVLATLPAVQLAGTDIWNDDLGLLFLNTTLLVILGTTILTTIFAFATESFTKRKNSNRIPKRAASRGE